jgi:prepilin-type N-terminal cleavage/methylation domain-containing protein
MSAELRVRRRTRRRRHKGFTVIELMATLALSAIVAGIAVGLFSSLVGPVTTWRSRAGLKSRAAIAAHWLRDEVVFAGGGPLPSRLAVAVDARGALHLLQVIPPGVRIEGAAPLGSCADGSDVRDAPSCPRALGATTTSATFLTTQWPLSVRSVSPTALFTASALPPCPDPAAAPFLALVGLDRIAVVRATSSAFDAAAQTCAFAIEATNFPGTDAPGAVFEGGAALPVRWHSFAPDVALRQLRASWNGAPPLRAASQAGGGVALVPVANDDTAIAQLAAFEVRFGEDTSGDDVVDAWFAPDALPVARRDAVEVAMVLATPSARAPPRSVTLPSGAVFSSAGGNLLEPVVVRAVLAGFAP